MVTITPYRRPQSVYPTPSSAIRAASNLAWQGVKRKGTQMFNQYLKRRNQRSAPGNSQVAKYKSSVGMYSVGNNNTRVTLSSRPKKKDQKRVKFRKLKRVKINRKFQAKVKKAIEPQRVSGFAQLVDVQYLRYEPNNSQFVAYLGMGSDSTVTIGNLNKYTVPWFFGPLRVLDTASVLFNGKLVADKDVTFAAAGMFKTDVGNPKFHVKKSWVTFQLKNNSERTVYLKLHCIGPKNTSDETLDIATLWQDALIAENTAKVNIGNITVNTLHNGPRSVKQLRDLFNFAVTKVTLEPGQTYEYKIVGPEDFNYDWSKFYKGTSYQNLHKMMRTCLVTGHFDLQVNYGVGSTALNTRTIRAGQNTYVSDGTQVGGISVEYREFYDITMPEITGGTGVGIGAVEPLTNRQDTKYYKSFEPTSALFGNEMRVDAVNPNFNLNPQ